MFLDQSRNAPCRNVPSLAALSAERSSEPSKVSAGTAECHILVLNDMKTVKAPPPLDFCREGKAHAGLGRMCEGLIGQRKMKKSPFENGVGTCN